MVINFKKIIKNKRVAYMSLVCLLFLFTIALNTTFSAFSTRQETAATNIKVAGMNYGIIINGIAGTKINVPGNQTTTSNIVINSLNNVDSKYELIYKVCSDSTCTNFINKPDNLTIEYSSRTIDTISGAITSDGAKQIRIAITNTSATTYYIKLDINAGYIHNTLSLKNLITTEYNEEDVKIAAIIDGEVSTTFPTTKDDYTASVSCTKNGGATNATGTATWNGIKWVVNITGVDTGQVICNVVFGPTFKKIILAQGGGASAIEAKGNPNFTAIATAADTGLYAAPDDYGTSYYYRGLKANLNNNLIWGGFQWKIIRINGDGSIRLMYNGTEAQFNSNGTVNSTGTNTQITSTPWNQTHYADAKYVGYMYGGANGAASTMRHGTTSAAATFNETSSNAKTILDTWYRNNISGKAFESQIVDALFCNDRQLSSEVGGTSTGSGYGTSETHYAAYYRLYTNKSPTLKCGLKNDRFTVNDTTLGNGSLTYPVGLLTADEASFAGLISGTANSSSYLYTNSPFWLFSPYSMSSSGVARVLGVFSSGNLINSRVEYSDGVRPAVSLSSSVVVTGTGSMTDPFRV